MNNIRFIIKNLGLISDAEITLNQMTVLAGKNSVSKTYLTYLIFGFLDYIKSATLSKEWQNLITTNLHSKKAIINLSSLESGLRDFIVYATKNYTKTASKIMSIDPESDILQKFSFNVHIDKLKVDYTKPFTTTKIEITQNIRIEMHKSNKSDLEIFLIVENNAKLDSNVKRLINSSIAKAVSNYFLNQIFPSPFIITSERTGVLMFYRELDNSRNTLIEALQQSDRIYSENAESFMKTHISRYPLPIKLNMDFTRNLFDLSKNKTKLPTALKSFIAKQISRGKYSFDKNLNQIFFTPDGQKRLKLPIHTASSSIKSSLLFDAYTNFVAGPNQILIIDEPELSLHPDNQRKMARFLAMLVNYGVQVMFTTHSDYIIKEINNLVMLHNIKNGHKANIINYLKKDYNSDYTEEMLLSPNEISSYTIFNDDGLYLTLKNQIDQYGINLGIIDDEINNLGEISEILYTELENNDNQ